VEAPTKTVRRTATGAALLLAGIVLIAANLRPGITVVGPLVGDIRATLGLSNAGAGLLTTLPVLAFAVLSLLAPPIARRIGIERTLGVALVLIAAGALLRSAGPAVAAAFVGTTILGAGIAAGNVLLPGLIKRDYADRSGQMTSIYVTAMVAMAGIAPAIAVPLADDAGFGWRGALACWSVPAALAFVVWLPRLGERHAPPGGGGARAAATPWRSPLAWQITVFMGLQSLSFYGLVAWLPELLREDGMGASSAGLMLGLMQLVSLASTIGVPVLAARRGDQRWLVALSAAAFLVALLGLLAAGHVLAPLWAALLGLGGGGFLSLALTFLLMRAPDAAHTATLSGMVQSGGYTIAAAGPAGFGALRDLSGGWTLPLLVFIAVTLGTLVAGLGAARDLVVDFGED
jgi:MFS transporter, CP family, cyanate transporter